MDGVGPWGGGEGPYGGPVRLDNGFVYAYISIYEYGGHE